MKRILSIQSHVAYGYVGNRAAVFPLQRLGFDVTALNTVQFSNHPGYGRWTGDVMGVNHVRSVVDGLRDLGVLYGFDAVLSGYLGDAGVGGVVMETVAEIKKHNPVCLYCCDPVMGDVGKGLFVKPDIPALFCDKAAGLADILTPNLFELESLTGITLRSLDEVRAACRTLHAKGVGMVLVTSLVHETTAADTLEMLVSCKDGKAFLLTTPYIALDPMPNGTGDLTAALYLGYILAGHDPATALERTGHSVFTLLEGTSGRELKIIENQKNLLGAGVISEKPRFSARTLP